MGEMFFECLEVACELHHIQEEVTFHGHIEAEASCYRKYAQRLEDQIDAEALKT